MEHVCILFTSFLFLAFSSLIIDNLSVDYDIMSNDVYDSILRMINWMGDIEMNALDINVPVYSNKLGTCSLSL